MTEVEKRRIKLLQETRKQYSEKYAPPAIHPRYHSAYETLYGREEDNVGQRSTLLIRCFISIIVFAIIFSVGSVKQQFVVSEIQKSFSQNFPTFIK